MKEMLWFLIVFLVKSAASYIFYTTINNAVRDVDTYEVRPIPGAWYEETSDLSGKLAKQKKGSIVATTSPGAN